MAGAAVKVTGLEQAKAKIATAKKRPLSAIVGTLVVAGVKRMFVESTDPDTGNSWKPIKNRDGQPLRDKGLLMRSIHYERLGSEDVTVGTNLIYAATHQFGDPNRVPKVAKALRFVVMGQVVFARKVSIPRRRFIPMTDAGLKRVAPGLAAAVRAAFEETLS